MGEIFKNKKGRTWLIVSSIVLVLLLVVNIVTSTFLYSLVCIVLGGQQAIYADGVKARYEVTTESKEQAAENGNALTQLLCEEGITLLKNDGALPMSGGERISVFGKNSVNLVYGGSGSGGGDNTTAKNLYDSLEAAGFSVNPTLREFYSDDSRSGAARDGNPSDLDSGGNVLLSIAETPKESYTSDVTSSYAEYSDAAIIVLSRIGGEGFDLSRSTQEDASRHYLELSQNEEDLIKQVCEAGFDRVILLINSASVMELDFVESGELGNIDACLWMGGPGNYGVMALGRVLSGEVNPSGHTVDTYIADFTKDPTYQNFGDNNITQGDKYTTDKAFYFVDYEESIYVGYRYWETRALDEGEAWYQENVVYPFGYGLSYTEFEWGIEDASSLDGVAIQKDGTYTIKVKVTNVGDLAGKEVVQLYGHAPYTAGGIEKAEVVLVGFAKTELIQPGESDTVEITFDPYYLASYDYSEIKVPGGGYILEAGDEYKLYISHNSHDRGLSVSFRVDTDILFNEAAAAGYTVENRFEDIDDHLGSLLTRSDWEGTMPASPTDSDRAITQEFVDALNSTATNNPNEYTEMPDQGVEYDAVIRLTELVGLSYDDPMWDEFLDQLTVDEMANLYNQGAFHTESIERLGVPRTTEADGPVGFVNFMGDPSVYGTCAYPCEVMMASTWNVELLEEMGANVAQEGLWGNQRGDGMPYSGLYAPGVNIHRSQFGGRNFEYFSEDSFLSGMMAAYEMKGARENGVVMFMKHFVGNEQETHRSVNGNLTWVTEQALREIYLRPFEIAVRVGGAMGIMSSFNRLGQTWTGGDYRLLTDVLRNEWGFKGTVICDFNTNSYMSVKQMIYAGGDLNLSTTRFWTRYSAETAGDVVSLRNAAHNILYTVTNTNAVNGEIIGYSLPTWQIMMFVLDAVAVVALAIWGYFTIRRIKTEKA